VVATGIDAAELKTRPEPLPNRTSTARAAPAPLTAATPDRPAEAAQPTAAEETPEAEPASEAEAEIEVEAVSDDDETPAIAERMETAPAQPTPQPTSRPAPQPVSQPGRVEPSLAFRQPETPAATAPRPAPAPAAAPSPAPAARTEQPSGRRVPFIPPKPMTPSAAAGSEEREPSIMTPRSGEHVNELGQPARRRSLFERMTGVSRTRDAENDGTGRSQREALEPRLHGTPKPAENPAPKAAPENPPARVQSESAEKQAENSPSPEEEVLEIPAFLRRQAN
jgi:cell division protein FtsZ